jgi:hypothetical protein
MIMVRDSKYGTKLDWELQDLDLYEVLSVLASPNNSEDPGMLNGRLPTKLAPKSDS